MLFLFNVKFRLKNKLYFKIVLKIKASGGQTRQVLNPCLLKNYTTNEITSKDLFDGNCVNGKFALKTFGESIEHTNVGLFWF